MSRSYCGTFKYLGRLAPLVTCSVIVSVLTGMVVRIVLLLTLTILEIQDHPRRDTAFARCGYCSGRSRGRTRRIEVGDTFCL